MTVRSIANELAKMDFWNKLLCPWRYNCITPSPHCDHLLGQDCFNVTADLRKNDSLEACPLLESDFLLELFSINCNACRVCQSEILPDRICPVCRRISFNGNWTNQNFAAPQTKVKYAFCDDCRFV